MSVADDMFKKLGYKKIVGSDNNYIEYSKKDEKDKTISYVISFDRETKTVMSAIYEKGIFYGLPLAITIPEIKAIERKAKELWDI